MAVQVVDGTLMSCTFGMSPASLSVLPTNKVSAEKPAANIMDNIPNLNIAPFGMCQSMANPQVAAATAAAMGALTPMPCLPVVPAPWSPGSPTVLVANMPALTSTCMANCVYGGIIQFSVPGQMSVLSA